MLPVQGRRGLAPKAPRQLQCRISALALGPHPALSRPRSPLSPFHCPCRHQCRHAALCASCPVSAGRLRRPTTSQGAARPAPRAQRFRFFVFAIHCAAVPLADEEEGVLIAAFAAPALEASEACCFECSQPMCRSLATHGDAHRRACVVGGCAGG